jgi:hypothetical protein
LFQDAADYRFLPSHFDMGLLVSTTGRGKRRLLLSPLLPETIRFRESIGKIPTSPVQVIGCSWTGEFIFQKNGFKWGGWTVLADLSAEAGRGEGDRLSCYRTPLNFPPYWSHSFKLS